MFGKGYLFFRILAAILLIGLLVGVGAFAYQAGQAQGYAAGLAAAGKETTVPGNAPFFFPYWGFGWHFFPFGPLIGFFFFCWLIFLLFGVIGGGFRRHGWRRSPEDWRGYPPYAWGPPPAAGQPGGPANPANPAGGAQTPPPAEPGK